MAYDRGIVVIPARYHSSRLEGKPLADICGQTLLQRTYAKSAATGIESVVVTDHEQIRLHCEENDIPVVMITAPCATGTDRVARYISEYGESKRWVINLQGDEPFADPNDILSVAHIMETNDDNSYVITGMKRITTESKFYSESIPKVLFDTAEYSVLRYMSRAPIPYPFKGKPIDAWEQVCIYGFRPWHLEKFLGQQTKTHYENMEDIEILRFMEMGIPVRMLEMQGSELHVDTPADLQEARRICGQS